MTTSMNETGMNDTAGENAIGDMLPDDMLIEGGIGGAFADGLTLIRILLTPIIMGLIIKFWPITSMAALASVLFLIAALTDIFDDFFGGTEFSVFRRFGYLDDVADTILCAGTLAAMVFVTHSAGFLAWPFAVPAAIIIAREIIVGLVKGKALTVYGWPDNFLSNAKSGCIMLGVCILVASPWLTQWFDILRANDSNVVEVFNEASPLIWIIGEIVLWIGAIFSVLSAIKIFKTPLGLSHDE
ncbi:MAG: CDP-alcohol phosphatidyltransferase family protein [Litorimonas sp.]